MWRVPCGDKADLLQLQAGQRFLRQTQVPEMDWVEGATEDSQRAQSLTPHMAITEHNKFLRG